MKDIGAKLKEARIAIGISIEEAAEDLKLRPSQIENIEEGNMEAFQDIFYLKYFIRDYSKYLGLNKEEMVDEFNEYLFDYTSKISLNDIKNAQKKMENKKQKVKKIASPYTLEKKQLKISPIVIYAIIIVLIALIIYFVIVINKNSKQINEDRIAYIIK